MPVQSAVGQAKKESAGNEAALLRDACHACLDADPRRLACRVAAAQRGHADVRTRAEGASDVRDARDAGPARDDARAARDDARAAGDVRAARDAWELRALTSMCVD